MWTLRWEWLHHLSHIEVKAMSKTHALLLLQSLKVRNVGTASTKPNCTVVIKLRPWLNCQSQLQSLKNQLISREQQKIGIRKFTSWKTILKVIYFQLKVLFVDFFFWMAEFVYRNISSFLVSNFLYLSCWNITIFFRKRF